MSEDWDIDNLQGMELRNLLSILVSIGEKNDEVMNNIEHYIQEQKDYLLLQDMRELFWKQIPFELTSYIYIYINVIFLLFNKIV